jgi:hypothetical protein
MAMKTHSSIVTIFIVNFLLLTLFVPSLAKLVAAEEDLPFYETFNVNLVNRIDRPVYTVAVQGNYLYMGRGSKFTIYDISKMEQPTFVSELVVSAYGNIEEMVIVGNYAYAILEDGRGALGSFTIIDITNPKSPYERGSIGTGYPRGIEVFGNFAYIAATEYLEIVDVSNPDDPQDVGFYDNGTTMDVAILDGYAYLAQEERGLHIVDVSDPSNPRRRGVLDVAFHIGKQTYSISGRVIGTDNEPIANATISTNMGVSATTDTNGMYTLHGIPAGAYSITPSKNGYTFLPESRSIDLLKLRKDTILKDFKGRPDMSLFAP